MMPARHVRGTVLAALLGSALCLTAGSALAGCGSATASGGAPAASSAATSGGFAASASPAASSAAGAPSAGSPAAGTATGCASVNQATSVTVHRTMRLVEPARAGNLTVTQHNATLVRALFGQFCQAVGHKATAQGVMHCPGDFAVSYSGTFYAGSRPLARFVYGASGCQVLSLTADGKTQTTQVLGTASAAAPKLVDDMAAVLGMPPSMLVAPAPVRSAPVRSASPVNSLR
jgi:hypothetical protein